MGTRRNSPRQRLSPIQKKATTTLQFLLDSDSSNHNDQSTTQSNSNEIVSLISYCSSSSTVATHLFESPSLRLQINLKRDKLMRLLSIIKFSKSPFPHHFLSSLFAMISSNLFRPLPPPSLNTRLDDDDDHEIVWAVSWPHLQVVYDILAHLVVHLQPHSLLVQYIDNPFILGLLNLFHSEDPREREALKNVVHKIYSKFHFSRSFMRKAMNDVFLLYIYDTSSHQTHCGIGDLLEIWGTIINGFSLPLKEEHKLFLTRVLIPLHRPKGMQAFHKQLAYCIYQFVDKEPMLGVDVVKGILKYWPITNCNKQVLLIGELEELVAHMGTQQYDILALPLCAHITKCINSTNSQVAERALYVWNNEQFVKMASQAMDDVFPVIVRGMENNLKRHWSKCVRQLTESVKQMLVEMEPDMYSSCLSTLHRHHSATIEEEIRRRQRWTRLEMAAKINQMKRESASSLNAKTYIKKVR